jgi:hypothetical protein
MVNAIDAALTPSRNLFLRHPQIKPDLKEVAGKKCERTTKGETVFVSPFMIETTKLDSIHTRAFQPLSEVFRMR